MIGTFAWLEQLRDYGLAVVKNTPIKEKEVLNVAGRMGGVSLSWILKMHKYIDILINVLIPQIRETFYGRHWNVINVVKAHNVAYTNQVTSSLPSSPPLHSLQLHNNSN